MGYLKQHCFTVDNVKEFFLSPYTYIALYWTGRR